MFHAFMLFIKYWYLQFIALLTERYITMQPIEHHLHYNVTY